MVATHRRRNGEGSVFYRKDREKWMAQVCMPGGKIVTRSADTEEQASVLLAELREVRDGRDKSSRRKKTRATFKHLSLRLHVLSRDNFTCRYCGRRSPDVTLHVDHIVPVVRGGSNDPANLVTACEECNWGKKARMLPTEQIETLMRENAGVEAFYRPSPAEVFDGIMSRLDEHWEMGVDELADVLGPEMYLKALPYVVIATIGRQQRVSVKSLLRWFIGGTLDKEDETSTPTE